MNRYIAINELVAMDGRLKAEWLNEMTIEGLGPMLTDVKKRDYVVRVQEKRVDFKRLEECRRQLEGCDVFDVFKARALRREIEEIRVKWAASSLNAQTKSASPLHPLPEGKGATGEKPEGPEIRMIN